MDSVEDIPASRDRFPDSEICGSESARLSPQLIAACYVLHRLCAPRHPPDALALTLDRSAFVPCPERRPAAPARAIEIALALASDALTRNGHLRSVLSVVLEIDRLCCRQIPPFTISENRIRKAGTKIPCRSAFQTWLFPPLGYRTPTCVLHASLVEPIGIEPTTSSLQSSRSPN